MTARPVIVTPNENDARRLGFLHFVLDLPARRQRTCLAFNLSCAIINIINSQPWLALIPHRLECRGGFSEMIVIDV